MNKCTLYVCMDGWMLGLLKHLINLQLNRLLMYVHILTYVIGSGNSNKVNLVN